MILPLIGGVFALLFILYSISRAFQQRTGTTLFSLLLAALTIAPLSAYVLGTDPTAGLPIRVILVVGMLLVAGVVMLWVERRRAKPSLNASQGVMTLGVSGLLLASIFIDPMIVDTLAKSATAKGEASQPNSAALTAVSSSTPTENFASPTNATISQNAATMMTNTPQPTITPLSTRALPDPLPTRFIYTTLVPTATSAQVEICEAVVQHNLNLRVDASAQSELLATIPFSTVIPVFGRNNDNLWLYVRYNNQFGWVSAQYLLPKADCKNLPIQA